LEPESLREPAFRARLAELAPELVLVASYGELIDVELLELPPLGWINVHGSLLPRWRGASPVQAAILAGDERTGVSIQRVVKKLDAGDVCMRRELAIGAEETGGELFERLARLGAEAALEALDLIAAGRARFEPQDPAGITRCRKLRKEQGRLDWSEPAEKLARRVRAMNPWPAAFTSLPDGSALKVLRARAVEGWAAAAPGTPRFVDNRVLVAAGEGALELLEVQPAGKRAMEAAAWWRGARVADDALLGGA
jgi:methionyl-tRNA formyltransferase